MKFFTGDAGGEDLGRVVGRGVIDKKYLRPRQCADLIRKRAQAVQRQVWRFVVDDDDGKCWHREV